MKMEINNEIDNRKYKTNLNNKLDKLTYIILKYPMFMVMDL